MVVKHNMSAMNTQRQHKINNTALAKNSEKLASGYRINRAADDAAGISISEKMRRQIRGLNQGSENIQDGISVCKVMDGTLSEVHDILHRMTELSVKSANGTWSAAERYAIDLEMRQLLAEIDRLTSTEVNGQRVLAAGDVDVPGVRVDSGKADIIFVIDNTGSMGSIVSNVKNNLNSFADGLRNCDVQYGVISYGDTQENGGAAFDYLDFSSSVSEVKEYIGKIDCDGGGDDDESALEALMQAKDFNFRTEAAAKEIILITDAYYHDKASSNKSIYYNEDVVASLKGKGIHLSVVTTSNYMDAYEDTLAKDGSVFDIASGNFYDSFMGIANKVVQTAGEKIHKNPADIVIQMNGEPQNIHTIRTWNLTTATLGIADINCLTQESSSEAIGKIAAANIRVSTIRGGIGSDQNALEHAYNNNTNTSENTQSAESNVRDMDMATGMVAYANQNILEQAIDSMMAQANQANRNVLDLLA